MKMTKCFEKDKPWDSCGDGTLDDPEIIWLKQPGDLSLKDGIEQVCHLLATQEFLTHVWLRGGAHDTTSASDVTGNHGVDDDDHLTVYCRKADGQLLEGHVYCVIDGQSGKFMAREARKHARDGQDQPVKLHNFDLRPKRRTKLVSRLLQDYEAWRKIQGPLFQQNA